MTSIIARFAFSGIVLLAVVLRLWGMWREDAWYDEIATIKYLGEPTVGEFLTEMQAHNPPVQPLYPVLEYFWYHWLGQSVVSLRLFSAVLIVPTLLLLRALGARLISERAGLIAAFVVAVSHVSIFYSLEVRMYSLTLLLSVASLYALVRLADSGGRIWWALNVACTVVIVWTHILGVFFLVCQFVFLAVHFGKAGWKRTALWCVLQGLAVATILPWLLGADYAYIREQYVFRETPTLFGLHGLSVLGLYLDWIGASPAATMSSEFAMFTLVLNRLIYIAYFMVTLDLGRRLYMWMRAQETERREQFNRNLLIATVAVVPVLMLYLLSVLWEPSFFDRYVLVSLTGLALLMGLGGEVVRPARLRTPLIAGLALLMTAQAVMYLSTPARRPWREANGVIAGIDARRVNVRLYGGSAEIMMTEAEFHLGGENIELVMAYEDLGEMDREFLNRYVDRGGKPEQERDVVITFSTESAGHLLQYFKVNDVAYTSTVLPSRMPLICIELGSGQ